MGLYFGKVQWQAAPSEGLKEQQAESYAGSGIVNDTAVAVDQLGVRAGAAAVYLMYGTDLPEFLQIRTNNGDERMKAHEVFPAVCYPDLFGRWRRKIWIRNGI